MFVIGFWFKYNNIKTNWVTQQSLKKILKRNHPVRNASKIFLFKRIIPQSPGNLWDTHIRREIERVSEGTFLHYSDSSCWVLRINRFKCKGSNKTIKKKIKTNYTQQNYLFVFLLLLQFIITILNSNKYTNKCSI